MKAEELRVGNLVNKMGINLSDASAVEVPVKVDIDILSEIYRGNKCDLYHPIPITTWLLDKFFKVTNGVAWADGDDWTFTVEDNDSDDSWDCTHYGIWIATVSHAHQLQNLYFALTGKEL